MKFTPRRIRVLELRDTHEVGGPGKTILETFKAIDAHRFDVRLGIFLTRNETADNPFIQAANECGMPVHCLHGYNQFDPRLIQRTAKLVREQGIDIVHAHEVKSDAIAYLASFLRRVPIVTTVHGWIANSARQRALVALDRRLAARFDRVIVVSAKIRDELLRAGLSDRTVRLVHNGLVLANYRRSGHRGALAAHTGRFFRGPVIASIGRLSREKGHADLLDAVARVVAAGHQCSVVLAGDGPERPALEERSRQLGLTDTVHFLGYVARPQLVLEEADLVVLPSHTEGLPNAVLEALAMGVPVLATAVGGTPEVISDGITGRLVPPSAPEMLAREMIDFMNRREVWRAMAERGRAVVERDFDFTARTRKMERLYDELMVTAVS
jgi:glycosyltransferase involved in cell wall biosynthesis